MIWLGGGNLPRLFGSVEGAPSGLCWALLTVPAAAGSAVFGGRVTVSCGLFMWPQALCVDTGRSILSPLAAASARALSSHQSIHRCSVIETYASAVCRIRSSTSELAARHTLRIVDIQCHPAPSRKRLQLKATLTVTSHRCSNQSRRGAVPSVWTRAASVSVLRRRPVLLRAPAPLPARRSCPGELSKPLVQAAQELAAAGDCSAALVAAR